MNPRQDKNNQHKNYAELLSLLEKNMRYLEALGIEEALIQDYRKVLSHLRRMSAAEVSAILGEKGAKKSKQHQADPDLTDNQIAALTSVEVEQLLKTQKNSRAFLERIATLRFGMTKGGLSVLRSREALVDKLHNLLTHEDTHEAISRAALGQNEGSQSLD